MSYENFDDRLNSALSCTQSDIEELIVDMDGEESELEDRIERLEHEIDDLKQDLRDIQDVRDRISRFEDV